MKGKGEGERAAGKKVGQQAENEEGWGGKGISFSFSKSHFQIHFQRVFESFEL